MFGKWVEERKLNKILEILEVERLEKNQFYEKNTELLEALTQSFVEVRKKLEDMQDLLHKQAVVRHEEFILFDSTIDQIRVNQTAINKDVLHCIEAVKKMDDITTSRDHTLYQELLKLSVETNSLLDYAEFDVAWQELKAQQEEIEAKLNTLINSQTWTTPSVTWNTTASAPSFTVSSSAGTVAPQFLEITSAETLEQLQKKRKKGPRKHTLTGDAEQVKEMQDALDNYSDAPDTNAPQGKD